MGSGLKRSSLDATRLAAGAVLWPVLACACASAPDYVGGYPPINEDLTINVVIENPAGTSEKWEVQPNGELVWERGLDGELRRTHYLPWPTNGGMIPRTHLDPELGGDGETLDVLVLGETVERGRVVQANVIGSIQILEALGRDDKILAVLAGSVFEDVTDVDDLETRFPGVREILSTYYDNYVVSGARQTLGFGSRAAARRLIADCHRAYEERARSTAGSSGPESPAEGPPDAGDAPPVP
jgi:inorganic pyrophosphatase